MANETLVELLKQGHAKFNAWRLKNPGAPIDLRGAQLARADLSKCQLDHADLTRADLRGVKLRETILNDAIVNEADLTPMEGTPVDLTGCHAFKASFIRASLCSAHAEGGLNLQRSDFTSADLTEVMWTTADLSSATLSRAVLAGAELRGARLPSADLTGASVRGRSARPANFCRAELQNARLSNSVLDGSIIDGASLDHAQLVEASIRGASARGTSFSHADLRKADLRDLRPDRDTRFAHAIVNGARIHRYTLEYLNDYGGLTAAERAEMEVINDIARLRQNFSGVFAIMHATALVLFVLPYLWFIASHYAVARFASASPADPTLLTALARFIVSGGRDWTQWAPSWRVIPFLVLLFYNALRAVLLYKTKSLELEELTTGLPSRFSFGEHPAWGRTFLLARWLFWGVLLVVLVHTISFMMIRVPL